MGASSSQVKQNCKYIQPKIIQIELETNPNSGQKQLASLKQECNQYTQKEVEIKESERDTDDFITDEEAIKSYLIGKEFYYMSLWKKNDQSDTIQLKIRFRDKTQIVSVIKALFQWLIQRNQKNQFINQIKNIQQFLQVSLQDLFEYNINLVKNEKIFHKSLELCCRTYHILQKLGKKLKTQKTYKQVIQDEEMLISEELKKQYLKIQSEIKLEIIRTFSYKNDFTKSQQQQNSLLVLMKFNTKHDITLAYQQTLKQQVQDYENSQQLQSLQDGLNYDIQNSKYDTIKLFIKNQLAQDTIFREKLYSVLREKQILEEKEIQFLEALHSLIYYREPETEYLGSSLSPGLFSIYLEVFMEILQKKLNMTYEDYEYADDICVIIKNKYVKVFIKELIMESIKLLDQLQFDSVSQIEKKIKERQRFYTEYDDLNRLENILNQRTKTKLFNVPKNFGYRCKQRSQRTSYQHLVQYHFKENLDQFELKINNGNKDKKWIKRMEQKYRIAMTTMAIRKVYDLIEQFIFSSPQQGEIIIIITIFQQQND